MLGTVKRWYREFHRWLVLLRDEVRQGRPAIAVSDEIVDAVRRVTERENRTVIFRHIWAFTGVR